MHRSRAPLSKSLARTSSPPALSRRRSGGGALILALILLFALSALSQAAVKSHTGKVGAARKKASSSLRTARPLALGNIAVTGGFTVTGVEYGDTGTQTVATFT